MIYSLFNSYLAKKKYQNKQTSGYDRDMPHTTDKPIAPREKYIKTLSTLTHIKAIINNANSKATCSLFLSGTTAMIHVDMTQISAPQLKPEQKP